MRRLIAEELVPRPDRTRTALRIAVIGAAGIGLMAALHLDSTFGPYALWIIIGTPAAALSPAAGVRLAGGIAAAYLIGVPLAGILVQSPWMLLIFFAAAATVLTFLMADGQLSSNWLIVEIAFLGTFYAIIFEPHNIGWPSAYDFASAALGIGIIVAFDMILWPDPADAALLRSLAAGFERKRRRLPIVVQAYLDPSERVRLSIPAALSVLPGSLPLLRRAAAENKNPHRDAQLLAGIVIHERIYIALNRLIVLERDQVSRVIRQSVRREIEAVAAALDTMLAMEIAHVAGGLAGPENWPDEPLNALNAAMVALDSRASILAVGALSPDEAAELSNLSSFIGGLREIALYLAKPPETLQPPVADFRPHAPSLGTLPRGPEMLHYCLKLAIAVTATFVVCIASQRNELLVAIWTALIVALPTYGAAFRKMILRFSGSVLGGIMTIAVILIVSPNFGTIVAYTAAVFAVLFLSALISVSSGRVAYAGKQAGSAFVLAYATLIPSNDIYAPLWRIWGILLGVIIVTIVFLVLWPEYARNALIQRLRVILENTLKLAPGSERLGEAEIRAAGMRIVLTLSELLGAADDARMEGRKSGVHPDSVIDASGTLRRIAHHLANIAIGRQQADAQPLPDSLRDALSACERASRSQLEYWLAYFDQAESISSGASPELPAPAPPQTHMDDRLRELSDRISANSFSAIAALPYEARAALLAELDAWRRINFLSSELDRQMTLIGSAESGRSS
ncbi:MAG: FUSC family protein [Candidatus Binataceae bacterium]